MKPFFIGVALAALTAPASAQNADLVAVSTHLKTVETMVADFSQTDRSGRVQNGVLTMKRPGRIRFQYAKGVPILLVADGKALTYIDYSVRQVQRWPIGNTPLGVLLDPKKDLARFAKIIPSANPAMLLADVRDLKHPEYGTLTLAFTRQAGAPGGLQLQGWVSLDSQNNRTTIRLSNHRFNTPVSDKAFLWSDPRPKVKGR